MADPFPLEIVADQIAADDYLKALGALKLSATLAQQQSLS